MEEGSLGSDSRTKVWLLDAQGGNQESFSRLYEHIAPSLMTWAFLRIRPEQRAHLDPADVVQEVWLRAWRQIEEFDGQGEYFRFWIFRVAKNVLLEGIRRGQKERVAGGPSTRLRQADALMDRGTAISQKVARDEGLARFREEVAALPEEERRLVLHAGLEGMPLAQVADRFGLSEAAVGKRWQRLRAKLSQTSLPQYLLS